MEHNAFFAKLCELEQDYETLQNCLQACQTLSPTDLDQVLGQVDKTYDQLNARLDSYVHSGRSPAIAALAQAQQTYYLTVKQLSQEQLPAYLHNDTSTPEEDRAEAEMLCAEYAIDFARQSIYHALHTVLTAVKPQSNHPKEDAQ